jgi:hypothetical protein
MRGNAQATYARGARGVADAERAGADGRTWWFVVMPGPPADAAPRRGAAMRRADAAQRCGAAPTVVRPRRAAGRP